MDRCKSCDLGCRYVMPTGRVPAQVMLIGEKPGANEERVGRVFVGDAGQELDKLYLDRAGLKRADVYISNCVKCRLGHNNNKPTDTQIATCSALHLPGEIDECCPEIIVLMGATACSLVPEISIEREHGIPRWATIFDRTGWVMPMYHPAAALHETSKMIPLLADFTRLKEWLRGEYTPLTDSTQADYQVIESKLDLFRIFHQGCAYKFIPVDTESDGARPWSMQFSTAAGNGYLIYAHRRDLIAYFNQLTQDDGLLLHNALYDLKVLAELGVSVDRPIRDTMAEAYHLGDQPQGLKSLAYRLLGVKMRDYEDVVMPPSRAKMVEWLTNAWDEAFCQRERVEIQLKTKVKYEYRPTARERGLHRILRHAHKPAYDLWEKARELGLAGYPVPSIAHVPEAEAIEYACQDADITGRIGDILERERERIVLAEWAIEEGDEDVESWY